MPKIPDVSSNSINNEVDINILAASFSHKMYQHWFTKSTYNKAEDCENWAKAKANVI